MNYVDYLERTERVYPDRIAVRHGEKTWTYAELADDVRSAASALAGAGVERGDAVAVVLANRYEFVVATLGTLALRATAVPLNVRFQRRELAHVFEEARPTAAVSGPAKLDLVADVASADVAVFATEPGAEGVRNWNEAVRRASQDFQVPHTLNEETAVVLYTSGTTGTPKGAVHTQGNFLAISDASSISYEMTPASTFLAVMPLYHCTGMAIVGTTLAVGGELLLLDEWEPETALRLVDDHDVTEFSGVPAMFKDWLAVADDLDFDGSSMETGIIGGAGVSAGLIERSEALLGCPVLNGFGMTETFAAGVWEDRRHERKRPSVGRATDRLVEVKVVDPETGEEVPRGEAGELLVRGETLMTGYLDAPGATEAAFSGEWFHTGDVATIDEDGYLFVQDRLAYTIITGGENVYPQEIEGVIEELPEVREAAVVGRPDDRKGEKPVAFVDVAAGSDLTGEAIRDHCLRELAAYKHPREVYFCDALPRNAVGKVDRETLADRL